ncbi:MAG: polyisoprenoid-binding protein [Burkholderiales bacterium RIFCSPHIGHO2_12_FULL_69_20]|nr:MAG: polyisoprenoid-binding protein [Burkholderiales bacterium RIFCSPHIGHO2_12_FULL_69_20]
MPMTHLPLNLPLTLLTTLAAAALAGPAAAQQVLPAQSEISFTSKQMGVPVEGRFKQWTAQITFDPKKPEAAKVGFTIQTGSASFGAAETDAEVPKAEWFNVARFPQASFASQSIKALGAGKFEVRGKLAIKGNSHDVVVPVTVTQAGAASTATGSFSIKRLDFKIGEGEWADTSMVANDVSVKFKLALSGMAPL